jgi:hypothetical protein
LVIAFCRRANLYSRSHAALSQIRADVRRAVYLRG